MYCARCGWCTVQAMGWIQPPEFNGRDAKTLTNPWLICFFGIFQVTNAQYDLPHESWASDNLYKTNNCLICDWNYWFGVLWYRSSYKPRIHTRRWYYLNKWVAFSLGRAGKSLADGHLIHICMLIADDLLRMATRTSPFRVTKKFNSVTFWNIPRCYMMPFQYKWHQGK